MELLGRRGTRAATSSLGTVLSLDMAAPWVHAFSRYGDFPGATLSLDIVPCQSEPLAWVQLPPGFASLGMVPSLDELPPWCLQSGSSSTLSSQS